MSVSKKWISDPENVKAVLKLYRQGDQPMQKIAQTLGTTWHNVGGVIKEHMTLAERKACGSLHHSVSKTNGPNGMRGKFRDQHHNWIGECNAKNGYKTILNDDSERVPAHHYSMLKALGLKELPPGFVIHHIDEDITNNHPDNLAIASRSGHMRIHAMYKGRPLKKLKSVSRTRSMT